MAKIVILGGGFAAISAAEPIANAVGRDHDVTLVSNNRDFTFYPAIVPMVFGDFRPEEIHFDLRPKLAEHGINFIHGEVTAINIGRRTVDVIGDRILSTLDFDYLIIAVGRRLMTGIVPGLADYSQNLLSVEGALKFKEAIAAFESGSIVVGLCPEASLPVPVCESALALAKRFRQCIEDAKVTVTAVVPTTLERAFEGAALFRDIEQEFDRAGVRLVSEFAVGEVGSTRLISAFGASLHYDLLMLIPPFGRQLSIRSLGNAVNFSGFSNVNSKMQVAGLEGVYATGDIVSVPGPKFGYMAMRQGRVAAANIMSELRGEIPVAEYSHEIEWVIGEKYTDPIFFHYGFWDETLSDFDDGALLGMARKIRDRYGPIAAPEPERHIVAG